MWPVLLFLAILAFLLPLEIPVVTTLLDKTKFSEWLSEFRKRKGVGLFGILMVGMSDSEAGSVINDKHFRDDIARYSAQDCWFLYFTQDANGQSDQQTAHEQHAEGVHDVTQWLQLDIEQIPCFVFFERPENDQYIYIPLQGLSKERIIEEVRSMFRHVRDEKNHKNYSTYNALVSYRRSRRIVNTGRTLLGALRDIAVKFGAEVISQHP